MKKILLGTALIVALSSSTLNAFAADTHYVAVLDAGSSGTRAYLYSYSDNPLSVTDLNFNAPKAKPGLATFAGDPQDVTNYLKPLIEDGIETSLKKMGIAVTNVNFYLLATAGMRTIAPDQQAALYRQITQYISAQGFKVQAIKTISGKWEGIYDWLAVNKLNDKLGQPLPQTNGVLDMGGASTEIAFATNQVIANNDDKAIINVGSQQYQLYSHSYLGLGQDDARLQYTNDANCFPSAYPLPNSHPANGELSTCIQDTANLVKDIQQVKPVTAMLANTTQTFYALSGYYNTADSKLFGFKDSATIKAMENQGSSVCQQSWESLQQQDPNDPYLYALCFNDALNTSLLTQGYGFSDDTSVNLVSKIKNQDVSWTLGVAICSVNNNICKDAQS